MQADAAELKRLGLRAIFGDVLDAQTVVRHDPKRLASLLLDRFVGRGIPRPREKKTRRAR